MTWEELRFRLYIMIWLFVAVFVVWLGEEAYFNTFRPLTTLVMVGNLVWCWRLHRLIQKTDKKGGI